MINLIKTAAAVLCVAAGITFIAPGARADNWDHKTTVTFSNPVEIPGLHLKGWAVLPAGTYVFKLMNSQTNRHVVQIFSADEKTVYATILAIPNTRVKRTDNTTITFRERPAGEPPALRAWFYPDASWGEEFVYPKKRAMEMAKTDETPVLYTPVETASEVTEPIQAPTAADVAQFNDTQVMAYNQTGQELELAQAVTPPAPPEIAPAQPVASPEPTMLPSTASPWGLIFLGGLIALGGAVTVQSIRQKV